MSDRGTRARAIAFYLPQFHPVPENDEWWGSGFTEWANVARARPAFRGHYQPHLPGELGFYDLRLPEVRAAQAELAASHGIEGFCWWHYWFEGRRLLGRPFDDVLASGEPSFPFCLAWANESWSRRWLGEERDVLMEQTYSPEDDVRHARWLAGVFADDRYLRVDGRPLFLVYRPRHLADPSRTIEALREEPRRLGVGEPYLVGVNAHCPKVDCRELGFDATLEFEPQLSVLPEFMRDGPSLGKLRRNLRFGVPSGQLKLYDYARARGWMTARQPRFPAIPSIFVGWDNSPRRGKDGVIVVGSTPERFEVGLEQLVGSVEERPAEERLVFLNAWNEWAEGNHLEPDERHSRAYLEAVARVLRPDGAPTATGSRLSTREKAAGERARRGGLGEDGLDRAGFLRKKTAPLQLDVADGEPARVNLLIPRLDFDHFFGGYISKFHLASRLSERGHAVRVLTIDPHRDRPGPESRAEVERLLRMPGSLERVELADASDRPQPLRVSPDDVFIATTWWSAHVAHRASRALDRPAFVYLIQEYEPFTFPMGSFAALAEETYDYPHFAVFSTELLRDFFAERALGVFRKAGHGGSVTFRNAITEVDEVSAEELASRRSRGVLVYARPDAHAARNMFEHAVLALTAAIEEGSFEGDWRFTGVGAVGKEARSVPLPRGAELTLLPRQSLDRYRELLHSHDVGLALMHTPHPSLVPLEMASAGMTAVTNTYETKTSERLAAISSNLIGVEPSVEALTAGLRQAAARSDDVSARAAGARLDWPTSANEAFDTDTLSAIELLLSRCR
jgi:hypothetical protein